MKVSECVQWSGVCEACGERIAYATFVQRGRALWTFEDARNAAQKAAESFPDKKKESNKSCPFCGHIPRAALRRQRRSIRLGRLVLVGSVLLVCIPLLLGVLLGWGEWGRSEKEAEETLFAVSILLGLVLVCLLGVELWYKLEKPNGEAKRKARLQGKAGERRRLRQVTERYLNGEGGFYSEVAQSHFHYRETFAALYDITGSVYDDPSGLARTAVWAVETIMPEVAQKILDEQIADSGQLLQENLHIVYGAGLFEWLTLQSGQCFPLETPHPAEVGWVAQDAAKWLDWWEQPHKEGWPSKPALSPAPGRGDAAGGGRA